MLDRRHLLKAGTLGGLSAWLAPEARADDTGPSPGKRVRGVVFMVADGMSAGVLSMAEQFSHLARNRGTRWRSMMTDPAAAHGLMDTASVSGAVTDSAAASSAWGSGQRTLNGRINVSPDGNPVEAVAQVLKRAGATTGLVTTATVTHATPAGFVASEIKRENELAIAPQYLNRADIILGGGRKFFDGKRRPDRRDLPGEFRQAGYGVVTDREAMLASRDRRLLGVFADGHLPYSIDRAGDAEVTAHVPSLAEMTTVALDRLLSADAPFLLQVEGARVDHAAHNNDAGALLWDQLAFDDALGVVLDLAAKHPGLLVVATSDHGNANPGLNGMGGRYSNTDACFRRTLAMHCSHDRMLAELRRSGGRNDPSKVIRIVEKRLSIRLDQAEAEALCSSMGSGEMHEWHDQLAKPVGLLGQVIGNHTGIGWTGTSHTSDPTVITALGPQASRFSGLTRNDAVFGHFVECLAG